MTTKRTTTNKTTAKGRMLTAALEQARETLMLETLETRGRDALDFHDLSVASIRKAIEDAFNAGYAAAAH